MHSAIDITQLMYAAHHVRCQQITLLRASAAVALIQVTAGAAILCLCKRHSSQYPVHHCDKHGGTTTTIIKSSSQLPNPAEYPF